MAGYDELHRLTGDELVALAEISRDIRVGGKGLARPGLPLANALARRGGLQPHSSIRALVALDELRRPRPETLHGLARGLGEPERSDLWLALWDSIPHPKAGS